MRYCCRNAIAKLTAKNEWMKNFSIIDAIIWNDTTTQMGKIVGV